MSTPSQTWRCQAHQQFSAGTCLRCGNPLCAKCVAENVGLVCAGCGKGPAMAPVSDQVPLQIAKWVQVVLLAALACFLLWQACEAAALFDKVWRLSLAAAPVALIGRVLRKPDDDSMIQR